MNFETPMGLAAEAPSRPKTDDFGGPWTGRGTVPVW